MACFEPTELNQLEQEVSDTCLPYCLDPCQSVFVNITGGTDDGIPGNEIPPGEGGGGGGGGGGGDPPPGPEPGDCEPCCEEPEGLPGRIEVSLDLSESSCDPRAGFFHFVDFTSAPFTIGAHPAYNQTCKWVQEGTREGNPYALVLVLSCEEDGETPILTAKLHDFFAVGLTVTWQIALVSGCDISGDLEMPFVSRDGDWSGISSGCRDAIDASVLEVNEYNSCIFGCAHMPETLHAELSNGISCLVGGADCSKVSGIDDCEWRSTVVDGVIFEIEVNCLLDQLIITGGKRFASGKAALYRTVLPANYNPNLDGVVLSFDEWEGGNAECSEPLNGNNTFLTITVP